MDKLERFAILDVLLPLIKAQLDTRVILLEILEGKKTLGDKVISKHLHDMQESTSKALAAFEELMRR